MNDYHVFFISLYNTQVFLASLNKSVIEYDFANAYLGYPVVESCNVFIAW